MTMTVGLLLAALQTIDPSTPVIVAHGGEDVSDLEAVDLIDRPTLPEEPAYVLLTSQDAGEAEVRFFAEWDSE